MGLNDNALLTLAEAQDVLKIGATDTTQAPILETLVNAISDMLERKTRRRLRSRTYTTLRSDGPGRPMFAAVEWPIIAITLLELDDVAQTLWLPGDTGKPQDFDVYLKDGSDPKSFRRWLYRWKDWTLGVANIKQSYTAGYQVSAVSFVDAFTRPDTLALGGRWVESEAAAVAIQVLTNKLRMANAVGAHQGIAFYDDTIGSDHASALTYQATTSSGASTAVNGPAVRVQGTQAAASGYAALYQTQVGGGLVELRKFVAEAASAGTLLGSVSVTLAAGDVLRIEAKGSALTVSRNGVSIITATDAAVIGGKPGLWNRGGTLDASLAHDWDAWVGASVETLVAPIPEDLKQACRFLVADWYKKRDLHRWELASQTIGGETVTFKDRPIPGEALALLPPYMRPSWGSLGGYTQRGGAIPVGGYRGV